MALKALLWGGFFAFCCIAAFSSPIFGVIGYMGHYIVGPEGQWWNAPLRPLGLRYSFTLAACAAVGTLMKWNSLRFGRSILHTQEKLMLLFLGLMWALEILGPETYRTNYLLVDSPAIKITKILIFILILTHVATNLKYLNWLIWTFIVGALILGMKAHSIPYSAFQAGRLETVGGPDFRDANTFGGFMAAMLFLIGIQFVRSGVVVKLICLVSGAFTANAIVLTRSRGAMLGIACGMLMALLLAARQHRAKIFAGLLISGLGVFYLMDPQSAARTSTITRSAEERDRSAQARIWIWKAGVRMTAANPLGVGPGNFLQSVGKYCPELPQGMVAHNTYIQCMGELGLPGLTIYCVLLVNAVLILLRAIKRSQTLPSNEQNQILWLSFGLATALTALQGFGISASVVYMEGCWWLMALPVCVSRTVDNLIEDCSLSGADEDSSFAWEEAVNEADAFVDVQQT